MSELKQKKSTQNNTKRNGNARNKFIASLFYASH